MKTMSAGEFKKNCLAVLDRVQKAGEPVLITKNGKAIAKLIPATAKGDDIFDRLADRAKIIGDIVSPTDEDWECK